MTLSETLPATAVLASVPMGSTVEVVGVDGERRFRRRLMELGLVPGTSVRPVKVAPLGDPLELEVRGCRLSIRLREARQIRVVIPEASR